MKQKKKENYGSLPSFHAVAYEGKCPNALA
jgi:hypothetical protein